MVQITEENITLDANPVSSEWGLGQTQSEPQLSGGGAGRCS